MHRYLLAALVLVGLATNFNLCSGVTH